MARNWISTPRVEGNASRQAHCDLPEGTYERELGKEGFFGPAAHMHHRHPPTAWTRFTGDLRPRAFDTTRLGESGATPWHAHELLGNAHVKVRAWEMPRSLSNGNRRSSSLA